MSMNVSMGLCKAGYGKKRRRTPKCKPDDEECLRNEKILGIVVIIVCILLLSLMAYCRYLIWKHARDEKVKSKNLKTMFWGEWVMRTPENDTVFNGSPILFKKEGTNATWTVAGVIENGKATEYDSFIMLENDGND